MLELSARKTRTSLYHNLQKHLADLTVEKMLSVITQRLLRPKKQLIPKTSYQVKTSGASRIRAHKHLILDYRIDIEVSIIRASRDGIYKLLRRRIAVINDEDDDGRRGERSEPRLGADQAGSEPRALACLSGERESRSRRFEARRKPN